MLDLHIIDTDRWSSPSYKIPVRGGLSDLGALSKLQVWGPNTIG